MEKLYNSLSEQGKYTKSFEDFQTQFGSKEGQEKLYGALESSGDYTKSFEDFSGQFFTSEIAKTNDSASADPAVESNQNGMGFKSENGSLELPNKEVSTWQSIKNSFSNMAQNVTDIGDFYGDEGGKDAAKDIAVNAIYSTLFGQKNLENKEVIFNADIGAENTLQAIERYQAAQGDMKETKGFIDSYEKGDLGGILAGGVNAITNSIGSMIYGTGTFGAGYLADFTARNYVEYNKQRADNLGVSLDELITSGEAETVVPVALGTASMAAEVLGDVLAVGSVVATRGKGKKFAPIVRTLPKQILNKILYNKKARAALTIFGTGAGEFATEITQHAIDEINDEVGRVSGTDESAKVVETYWNAITSKEGLEAGLQGFVGGGGMVTGAYSVKAMNTVRGEIDGDKLDKNLMDLASLNVKLKSTTDPTAIEGIKANIASAEMNIADQVVKGNKIYNSLDEGQLAQLESFSDLSDVTAFKITELNKKRRENAITDSEYSLAKDGFLTEYNAAKKSIGDLKLNENIEFLKSTIKTDKSSANLKETILDSTDEMQQALNNLSEIDNKQKQEFRDIKGRVAGFTVNGKIFINKEVASKTGQINVAKHEFLHKVLNAKVGDISAQKVMVKGLRKVMTKQQRGIVDTEMNKRGYRTSDQFSTEYVNVFSDLLSKDKISFEKSLMGKTGDVIKKFFIGKGFDDISFKDSRGVYNFLKDYNESSTGLSDKAKEAIGKTDLAKEGGLQFSKTVTEAEAALDVAMDADPNNPSYLDNIDKAEAELDAAEEAAKNPQKATPDVKKDPKKDIEVFHGGNVKDIKDIDGVVYFSEDKAQANQYAEGNNGEVRSFKLNEADITTEARIFEVIRELGIQPRVKGWTIDDSRLYELIDDRFEQAFTKEDMAKLKAALSEKGIKAARFTDTNLITGKDTENIVVFNKSAINQKAKPKPKVVKPKEPTRTTDLGPRDPLSQKIMDTYDVGMYGIERTEYRASKPLPAPLERKLVPMFEGYINTIVQQKFKQFATEALEFQDALSILRAEASSAIRTYNPAKNKDLAGYVKKIIQTRQSLMFKDANAEFAASLDDAKGVTATEDTQSIDRSGTVERGQATFDELDIVDDVLIEDIKKDLEKEIRVRVQKGTLSEMIGVKKGRETYMVSWLENYVNKQLFKKLSKKLGAIGGVYPNAVIPGSYIDFLNDPKTFDIITKALPIKSIKKSYSKLFPVERVGREVTAEGNPVFKISKIKPKEFLTYFVKGNKSTVLERQKQLFREILEPLAKQVVADYVTPENLAELKSIQELAPAESVDVVNNMVLEAGLNNLESQIDRYKGEQKTFDIIQFSLSKDEKNEIADRLFLNNTSNLTMADLVSQIIGQTLKPLIADRKQAINDIEYKLGPELYAKVEKTIIGPHLDSLLALKDKKSYQRGLFAEQLSWDAFKKVPGVKMISKRPSGKSGSSAPDIVIKYNNETIIFEIKSNRSDRITSVNVHNYTNPAAYKTTRNTGAKSEKTIFNELKNSKNLNSFIAKVDKMMAKFYPEQKKYTDKNGAIELTPEQIDRLNLTNSLYKETSTEIKGLNENLVETIYTKKGANYIGFADIGTFYVGENKNNLKVPKFEVDLYTRSWLYKSVLKENGKHSFPLRMFAQISTASGKKLAESSNKSIINTESIKTVLQASKSTPDSLNNEFNDILEGATGFKSKSKVSDAASKMLGKTKGRFDFFIPPSAEDFAGLMYKLTGKSKKGEAQQAWFKKELFDPFAVAMRDFESYKENATAIVNSLKKSLKNIPSGLKDTNATGFTNEVAARVIMWRKNGYDIPGLAESEARALVKVVQNDPDLLAFVKQMDAALGKYPPPQNDWLAGTVTTDAINMINTTKRGEFLKDWQANADVIFSKENKQKMRAGLGDNYVEALEDMLYRMETGRNRPSGKNKQTNQFMNWVNDSVGTIMFFNTRSAVLQLLSTVNFINWGDNNPAMAAKAFANQDLFWKDFTKLFNSDFLKQRRSGLKNDVNADDIANAAATATNKTRAVLSSILKAGFLPTQMADSFAIALGGASFVRNRTNTYIQQGMDAKMAEEKAFLEFQEIAEETQQSSRPDRVSQQQASPLGRIVLAFANTPMQYMRLTKKAVLDLKNGRGDPKTNITKILYYAFVQNVIFSGLQSALFAAAFEDEDEDVIDNKQLNVANSMMDSVLRGTGVYGAIGSTLKNIVLETYKQSGKDRPDYVQSALRLLSISPPVDSKMRKVIGVGRAFSYKSVREKMKEPGIDNPALYAFGQTVSAIFNVPLDRAIRKASNVNAALSNDTKYWQKVALLLGWSQWDLGLIETSSSKKKKKKGFGTTTNWKKRGSWKK